MTRTYPDTPSLRAGEELVLGLATKAPVVRLVFFRQGPQLERVPDPPGLTEYTGIFAESGSVDRDWAWPKIRCKIPADWKAGVYLVVVVDCDAAGIPLEQVAIEQTFATSGRAIFVVRRPRETPLPVVYILPLFAYHANALANGDGGTVALGQPGGGTGAPMLTHSSFDRFDAPILAWLAATGFDVEVRTDLDLHAMTLTELARFRLIVVGGESRYWSDTMRATVRRYVEIGGHVAFFHGRAASETVQVDVLARTVSFAATASPAHGELPTPTALRITKPDHWMMRATRLRADDRCGTLHADAHVPAAPSVAGIIASREAFERLATTERGTLGIGIVQRAGTIVVAETDDWAPALAAGDTIVARITTNVIERLAGPATKR